MGSIVCMFALRPESCAVCFLQRLLAANQPAWRHLAECCPALARGPFADPLVTPLRLVEHKNPSVSSLQLRELTHLLVFIASAGRKPPPPRSPTPHRFSSNLRRFGSDYSLLEEASWAGRAKLKKENGARLRSDY